MPKVRIRNRVSIPLKELKNTPDFITFYGLFENKEHIALDFRHNNNSIAPLVRIHSECMTGDVFHSLKCDCGEQLNEALQLINNEGGILLYMRHEGRGIGLYNKIDAYRLQNEGLDTFQANLQIGFSQDEREFVPTAQCDGFSAFRNTN
ncbi:GTP cyclohydrolase-2 (fragment) [Xenorhabdus poinarii G6]|uniref:GTP cyclohydrolase-2 n=1 Tax=Xenorhabdus poinarii G6 TaxID=1354304 RepID=A0A068R2K4_9GAMM